MRFRCDLNGRPSEYFLRIMHRMGMIRIISPVRWNWRETVRFFLAVSFLLHKSGENSADGYAPNEDANAQKSHQILPYFIQNIASGIRTIKHIRYNVNFLYISQLNDWRWVFKMPVIYVAKTSSYARRITFVLGQTVEKQHDPWLFLRASRRAVFVLPHSKGSFSGAAVPEPVNRCQDPVRYPAGPHEPVREKRLAGRAEPGVHPLHDTRPCPSQNKSSTAHTCWYKILGHPNGFWWNKDGTQPLILKMPR